MRNRLVYLFVAFIMIFSVSGFTTSINANDKDDITGHDLEEEMRYLNEESIMLGDGAGTFGPNRNVTRAEYAAFVARTLKLPIPEAGVIVFEDVPVNYMGGLDIEINRASAAGLIEGNNGMFRPGEKISREEMAVIINRALKVKGIEAEELAPLTFTDQEMIADWALEEVQFNVALKIINGYPDGSFKPKDPAIRAHAAKVIYEMIDVIESNEGPVEEPIDEPVDEPIEEYRLVSLKSDGSETEITTFDTIDLAMEVVNGSDDSSYHVKENEQYVWIPEHEDATVSASGQPFVLVYQDESLLKELTYVQLGSQLDFVSMNGQAVKVKISGITGYVNLDHVILNPGVLSPSKSYYVVNNDGFIYHRIFLNGKYEPQYQYMKATPTMVPGTTYYNTDGKTFGEEDVYHYFNLLPLYTETKYTAEQFNQFVANHRPTSPFKELGDVFKSVGAEYGINPLHLLALAIHESRWGESVIAEDKKNLFGMRATDGDPYNNAIKYDSYEDSIKDAARRLRDRYINRNSSIYNGPMLGNKSAGLNMKYASDPFWGQKVASHMMRIDSHLANEDTKVENRYRIGVTLIDELRVRRSPWGTEQYKYPVGRVGISMVILGEEVAHDGTTWYKIISDHPDYEVGYVYAYGDESLGQYVKELEFN